MPKESGGICRGSVNYCSVSSGAVQVNLDHRDGGVRFVTNIKYFGVPALNESGEAVIVRKAGNAPGPGLVERDDRVVVMKTGPATIGFWTREKDYDAFLASNPTPPGKGSNAPPKR